MIMSGSISALCLVKFSLFYSASSLFCNNSNASGLQSLVWWHHWNETGSGEYKDMLLSYNQEDCQALKLLTDE
jgi:hypothetical protein